MRRVKHQVKVFGRIHSALWKASTESAARPVRRMRRFRPAGVYHVHESAFGKSAHAARTSASIVACENRARTILRSAAARRAQPRDQRATP